MWLKIQTYTCSSAVKVVTEQIDCQTHLIFVYDVTAVLLVPARVQFVLFHPVSDVDMGETDCLNDLLTRCSFACSWSACD